MISQLWISVCVYYLTISSALYEEKVQKAPCFTSSRACGDSRFSLGCVFGIAQKWRKLCTGYFDIKMFTQYMQVGTYVYCSMFMLLIGKIGNKMQLGANQVVAMRKVLGSIMTQNIISNTDQDKVMISRYIYIFFICARLNTHLLDGKTL